MATKRLRKVAVVRPPAVQIHDRRASELNRGAVVGAVTVDNPLAAEPGEKIVVFRNLRDDPLAAMHDAKQVDDAQYYGGRHWQKSYELSELGGARGIDFTKEAVDGGRFPDPLTDAKSRAFADLAKARRALGLEGGAIIQHILGCHMTIALAAEARGLTSEAERKYLGRRFRECLDTLAVEFGFAMRR